MCVVRVRELAPDDFSGEHNHDCANEYCYVLVVELCDIAGPYLVWRVEVEVAHHAVPHMFAQIPVHCFCSRPDAAESHLLHELLDFSGNRQRPLQHTPQVVVKTGLYAFHAE